MIAETPIRDATRLPDYDYSAPGAYFVTVCCQNRKPFLDFEPAKEMVETIWRDIPNQFKNTEIDIFVVMPDHFHGIIIMKSNDNVTVGERPRALPMRELTTDAGSTNGKAQGPSPTKFGSVIDVVQWFKSLTTAKYRHGVKSDNWPPYFKKLWQRSFYDHVIRYETDLAILRDYILNNPLELNLVEESAK